MARMADVHITGSFDGRWADPPEPRRAQHGQVFRHDDSVWDTVGIMLIGLLKAFSIIGGLLLVIFVAMAAHTAWGFGWWVASVILWALALWGFMLILQYLQRRCCSVISSPLSSISALRSIA